MMDFHLGFFFHWTALTRPMEVLIALFEFMYRLWTITLRDGVCKRGECSNDIRALHLD